MFKYKITKVKLCVSLHKHHEVTIAETDGDAYTPFLELHRKLILTDTLLKVLQIYLKIKYFQKIEK